MRDDAVHDDVMTLVPPKSYESPRGSLAEAAAALTSDKQGSDLDSTDFALLPPDVFSPNKSRASTSSASSAVLPLDRSQPLSSFDSFPVMTEDDVREIQTSVSGAVVRSNTDSEQRPVFQLSPLSSPVKVVNTVDAQAPVVRAKAVKTPQPSVGAEIGGDELMRRKTQESNDALFAVGIQNDFSEKEINAVLRQTSVGVSVEDFLRMLRANRGHRTSAGNLKPPGTPSAPSPRKKKQKQDAACAKRAEVPVPAQYYKTFMEEEGDGLDKRTIIVDKVERLNILTNLMYPRSSSSTADGSPSPPGRPPVSPPQSDSIVIDSNDDDDDDVIIEGVSESDAWMKVKKDGKPSKRQRKRHRIRANQQKQQQQQLGGPVSSAEDDAALPTLNIAKAGPSGIKRQALVSPTVRHENQAGSTPDQTQSNATPFATRVPTHSLLPGQPPSLLGQPHMSAQQPGVFGQPHVSAQQPGVFGQPQMSSQQLGASGQLHMAAQPPGVPAVSFVPRREREERRPIVIDGSNVAVA